MNSNSSAGAQALGYIYQIPYALYLILESEENTTIRIEGKDDIESSTYDEVKDLLQLKRHSNPKTTLTDRSIDLWRTLRVWSRHLANEEISLPGLKLKLITTAQISEGSIAWILSPEKDQRDTEKAYQSLLKIANNPSETLEQYVVDFKNLSPPQQELLVEAIEILGNSPDFDGLKSRIIDKIKLAALDHAEKLYNAVMGWWVNEVIFHLRKGTANPISANAVQHRIYETSRDYQPDVLPPLYRDDEMQINARMYNYRFVLQLKAIGINQHRVERAIRDFLRSEAARAGWVRTELLIESNLLSYDKNLQTEWSNVYYTLDDKFRLDNDISIEEANEMFCKKFGQEVYEKVTSIAIPINNRTVYDYVTRGSYHRLANETNEEKPNVRWHPKFNELQNSVK